MALSLPTLTPEPIVGVMRLDDLFSNYFEVPDV